VKALLVNDLHIASAGPKTRLDDFHATMGRKLAFVEGTAKAHGVDVICIAGDLFHATTLAYQSGTYAPSASAVELFRRWAERWPVLVIPGNHDLPHDRMDLIPHSAFGALYATGFITGVWGMPYVLPGGGWVGGMRYPVTEEEVLRWVKMAARTSGPGILMVHAYASASGPGNIFGDRVWGYLELAQAIPEVKVWHFGHDHSDHGVVELGGTVFVQVGALLRGTRADDQMHRQPKLVVVRTENEQPLLSLPARVTWEEISVPIEPPEAVFDVVRQKQTATVSDQIETYVKELAELSTATSESPEVTVAAMADVSPEVRQRVAGYIERAS
jgi:DNA repair exonuclease SbcCD nuclease subunit